jgi:hypothetical protein
MRRAAALPGRCASIGENVKPCVLWHGATRNGYGVRRVAGRMVQVHRAAFIAAHGPIPPGHEVHHTCLVKLCREPSHLVALTPLEHKAAHDRRNLALVVDGRPCSRCGREPRCAGQGWGRECMNLAMRQHRQRRAVARR